MYDIHQLVRFRLAQGSHKQPNANGDICVTEAAILAAGFKHRAVKTADHAPQCFSRPLTALAMTINDYTTNEQRNELLMPFVLKLAGTRDTWPNEEKRLKFIVREIHRSTAHLVYSSYERRTGTVIKLSKHINIAYRAERMRLKGMCRMASYYAAEDRFFDDEHEIVIKVVCDVASFAAEQTQVWMKCADILDQAIRMGRHADLDVGAANTNIEKRLTMAYQVAAVQCQAA
jgi:hypothetical protein